MPAETVEIPSRWVSTAPAPRGRLRRYEHVSGAFGDLDANDVGAPQPKDRDPVEAVVPHELHEATPIAKLGGLHELLAAVAKAHPPPPG